MELFALIAALLLARHCLAEQQAFAGPDHTPYLRKGESKKEFFYRKSQSSCYSLAGNECLFSSTTDIDDFGNGCLDPSTGFDACCYKKWDMVCWDTVCDYYDRERDGPRAQYANLTTCKN
ncbi:hypothetical protein HDE_05138 [Halotydeus destructor]|nr:hypothetical protein HDE_05138 [Halotydeus destructor]